MTEKISYNWRYMVIGVAFSIFAAAIVGQMLRIQLTVNSQALPEAGELGQWEHAASRRGLILDRNGHVLAGNQTVYAVDIDFSQLGLDENDAELAALADLAVEVFEISNPYLLELLEKYPRPEMRNITVERFATQEELREFLDRMDGQPLVNRPDILEVYQPDSEESLAEQVKVIDCSDIPRISCTPHLTRYYPEHSLASNIIGFVLRDEKKGQLGVEEMYDTTLFGNDRTLWALWDPHQADQAPDPDHGANLVLTIDSVLQADVEQILDKAVKKQGALAGTIIVMDPETGDILAMASNPRADINEYWLDENREIINNRDNVFNYAMKAYEPGSVVKVLTMAAALDAEVVEPNTEFIDEGVIEIGGVKIRNWNKKAWGPQTMTSCMQNSLNVCLAWVATQLESEQFYGYFQDFGFGQMTGIELAGEVPGFVKSYRSPEYTRSELGTNAFGQGIEITPIQMIKAISAIANQGEMVAPRIIKAIVEDGYLYTPPKTVVGHPISAETAEAMTEMLRKSLKNESSLALVPGYSLAGKTGTAEIYVSGRGYTSDATNASFVGWGPTDDPQFIVYVWLSKPAVSIWGSETAAPVFRQVVERLVIHLGIPPDGVRVRVED